MKKTLFSAALAAAFGLVALQASASDGTITFTGDITDTTCTVSGGGAAQGTGNITVSLPTVSKASLPSGATAGDTDFSLVLGGGANCTNGKTASLWIDTTATPALDTATGALKNQTSGGSNVEVQMVNPTNNQKIDLGVNTVVHAGDTTLLGSNQPAATIAGNTATLAYKARYLAANAAATSGAVSTYLTYSMQYN